MLPLFLLVACESPRAPNPATLINWYEREINNDLYVALRPKDSLFHFENCTIGTLGRSPDQPPDLGLPKHLAPNDLEKFGGVFPQKQLSVFASSKKSSIELFSALEQRISNGSSSIEYLVSRRVESEHLQMLGLPLSAGTATINTFENDLTQIKHVYARNKTRYQTSGLNFSLSSGTGSLVRVQDSQVLLTAAHVLTRKEELRGRDIGAIGYAALDLSRFSADELYVSEIHKEYKSKDLVGKRLEIYFYRTVCEGVKERGFRLVYQIMPTVYDKHKDELYANVPGDFNQYMGGVSGAGVYSENKLVGVFVGIRCLRGRTENECDGPDASTAHLRFVGIDTIRVALERLAAKSSDFPIITY